MLTQDAKPCQRTGEIKKEGTCFGVQEYNGFYNNWSHAAQHMLLFIVESIPESLAKSHRDKIPVALLRLRPSFGPSGAIRTRGFQLPKTPENEF